MMGAATGKFNSPPKCGNYRVLEPLNRPASPACPPRPEDRVGLRWCRKMRDTPSRHFIREDLREIDAQADGVHMEQIGGELPVCVGLEESSPLAARRVAAGRGPEAGGAQGPADGGRADLVPESAQLAVHAAEPHRGLWEPNWTISSRSCSDRGGRPGGVGCAHFCWISRWCQAGRVRGETIRWLRSGRGSRRARVASGARSDQLGFGAWTWRRRTATSYRKTKISASLAADERASSTSHAKIRVVSR